VISHTSRERGGDAAVIQIELSITDKRLCGVDRGLCGSLFSRTLFYVLDCSSFRLLQRLSASQFLGREIVPGLSTFELRLGLNELDLILRRINLKQEIAFPHNVPVFEPNSRQRPADLCSQLDALYRRELT
jgi:hypothetical protein